MVPNHKSHISHTVTVWASLQNGSWGPTASILTSSRVEGRWKLLVFEGLDPETGNTLFLSYSIDQSQNLHWLKKSTHKCNLSVKEMSSNLHWFLIYTSLPCFSSSLVQNTLISTQGFPKSHPVKASAWCPSAWWWPHHLNQGNYGLPKHLHIVYACICATVA